jgi:O-methyltransferase
MAGWFRSILHLEKRSPALQQATCTVGRDSPETRGYSTRTDYLLAELLKRHPSQLEELLSCLCTGSRKSDSEDAKYCAAEAIANFVYPKYKFSEYGRLFLEDAEFIRYYQKFMDANNWHSLDRKYTLNQLLNLVLHLDGDFAECGAYKGASAFLMCRALRGTGQLVHLFDSFQGLPKPDHRDGEYWVEGALPASEEELHRALSGFGNYAVYPGWIPARFVDVADKRFSFVHIDVDLYRPTLDSLVFFYKRMITGGILLMDDYGFKTCPGAKQAADEFFSKQAESIVMLPTGQAFVMKR